jgi:hypothetical protein
LCNRNIFLVSFIVVILLLTTIVLLMAVITVLIIISVVIVLVCRTAACALEKFEAGSVIELYHSAGCIALSSNGLALVLVAY